MAEEQKNNVAPVQAEVKAEAKADQSAAQGKGNGFKGRSAQCGRRFSRGNGRGSRRPREKIYDEKVVKISRVAKVVKGGKRVRFTALVVIGDGKGKYGYGLGKSNEVPDAIKKALSAARRNVRKRDIAKNHSIAHPVRGHFGATEVFLKPAPEGTGLVAGGAVRAVLELAGVKNVYSKTYGARSQANVIKATVDGLLQLKSFEGVQLARFGKKPEVKAEKAEAKEAK